MANTQSPSTKSSHNEEPEIAFEESIPLDGKDEVGEKMMEDLGRERQAKQDEDSPPREEPAEPMPEQFPVS